ncbi:hypothetical protein [Larkinella punicea]|uniref:DinB family protein n=1 Tax=Larkinella punicea TaxID=2315727 RepID=A0A368JSS9_9BACT|nr:hypothetical protein [Larkinella punicea]RCR69653.1 hypothetical protein DUE52_09905 [Larkinella punicea]
MKLQDTSAHLLGQLTAVIAQLEPHEYTRPLDLLMGSSVGKHLRHIIEFYALSLTAYHTGYLNYDRRIRQESLENSPTEAVAAIQQMMAQLACCTEDRLLELEASYSPDAIPDVAILTTFYRELLYNIEHAIHHSAIIRIGLEAVFPHVQIPAHFGVAHATVAHQKRPSPARSEKALVI